MYSWRQVLVSSLMAGLPVLSPALPVFSRFENPYPSADIPKNTLEIHLLEVHEMPWVRVAAPSKKLVWVKENHLWSPVHVSLWARLDTSANLRAFPSINSMPSKQKAMIGPWLIHRHSDQWTQISLPHSGDKYWVENKFLTPVGYNWDSAVTKTNTSLRMYPQLNARPLCQIGAFEKLRIISFNGQFAQVYGCGGRGYVSLRDVLTKAHFASKVYTNDGWHDVLKVNYAEVVDSDHRPISFQQIRAFVFDLELRYPRYAIRGQSSPTKSAALGDLLYPHVALQTSASATERWGLSNLPKMGRFWWDMKSKHIETDANWITTDELLKRKVFDMVSDPRKPHKKWASAQGIFTSDNNRQWKKIEQFSDQDFPIYILPSGRIFVGPYYSDDGSTFHPFVRWDHLLSLLNKQSHAQLKHIRLSQIQPLDNLGQKIRLVFHIQGEFYSVETQDLGLNWYLARN